MPKIPENRHFSLQNRTLIDTMVKLAQRKECENPAQREKRSRFYRSLRGVGKENDSGK